MSTFYRVEMPAAELGVIFLTENSDGTGQRHIVDDGNLAIVREGAGTTDLRTQVEIKDVPFAAPKYGWEGADAGWIETKYLWNEVPQEKIFNTDYTLEESDFVRKCARTQLETSSGGIGSGTTVAAEFLVAVAILLSNLDKFGPRTPEIPDAIGPFQLSAADWNAYAEVARQNPGGSERRVSPFFQVNCAAVRMQLLANEMNRLRTADLADDDPLKKDYAPSFLDVLHAWLLNPAAALTIDAANQSNDPGQDVLPLIAESTTPAERARCKLVANVENVDQSVSDFVNKTSLKLLTALKTAYTKIETHAAEFVVQPQGDAPWFSFALAELKDWAANPGETEQSAWGMNKTVDYFSSIINGYEKKPSDAWCGAFTSWCVDRADLKSSLPNVPEGAKNWADWGDTVIPVSADTVPKGAVALIKPDKSSDTIGHVAFFEKFQHGKKSIDVVGGNQGPIGQGRVTRAKVPLTRVMGFRWLQTDQSGHILDEVSGDEELVVSMTLYGEARNQSEEGMTAVANVMVNRKALNVGFYGGDSLRAVCLKPWQFSCWNRNDPNRAKILDVTNHTTDAFHKCRAIAQKAITGTLEDITDGSTHYYRSGTAVPEWLINNPQNPQATEQQIGDHLFYKNVDF